MLLRKMILKKMLLKKKNWKKANIKEKIKIENNTNNNRKKSRDGEEFWQVYQTVCYHF